MKSNSRAQESCRGVASRSYILILSYNIKLNHSYIIYSVLFFFRWDVNHVERLPEYMKICFLFLYNEINQIGYEVIRDKGLNVIPYLKQVVSFPPNNFDYKSFAIKCKTNTLMFC